MRLVLFLFGLAALFMRCNAPWNERQADDHFEKPDLREVHFPDLVPTAIQVLGDELFVLHNFKTIALINSSGKYNKCFSLDDHSTLIQEAIRHLLENDTTYPFVVPPPVVHQSTLIDEFFITERDLYLSIRILLPYVGEYEGAQAQYNLYQRVILRIDRRNHELLRLWSIMVDLKEFRDKKSDQAFMEKGFVVYGDTLGFVRNLTFIQDKQRIPELLRISGFEKFKLTLNPYKYYAHVPEQQLTTTYGNFFGERRGYYCGSFGCLNLQGDRTDLLGNHLSNRNNPDRMTVAYRDGLFLTDQFTTIEIEWETNSDSVFAHLSAEEPDSAPKSFYLGAMSDFYDVDFMNTKLILLCKEAELGGFVLQEYSFY